MTLTYSEEKRLTNESICDTRKAFGLGCASCVLRGFQECPESGGAGESAANVLKLGSPHVTRARERGELGYPLHLGRYVPA